MADRGPCPICGRTRLVLPLCRGETTEEPCFGEGGGDCYVTGYERVSAELLQSALTIKAQDELLGRAREVLVDLGKKVNDALKRLSEVVRG